MGRNGQQRQLCASAFREMLGGYTIDLISRETKQIPLSTLSYQTTPALTKTLFDLIVHVYCDSSTGQGAVQRCVPKGP